jgi:hypothetical protein
MRRLWRRLRPRKQVLTVQPEAPLLVPTLGPYIGTNYRLERHKQD